MSRQLEDQPMLALAWMAWSALCFSVMAIFVKRLAQAGFPHFELVFFRSLLNLGLVLLLMYLHGELRFQPNARPASPRLRWLLVFRGLAGFGGVSCLFYSIAHLPLPMAMMLSWTSPIFVMLFSRIFLAERMHPAKLASIAVAFGGLLLLVQPDAGNPHARWLFTVGIAILGAMFAGGAYVAVRVATARVGVRTIVAYFVGISTLISLPLAATDFRVPELPQLIELSGVGLFATLAQLSMTEAYRFAPAGTVSTMSLLNAAFSAVFGWFIFGEQLAALQWMGMLILGVGVGTLTWRGKAAE